MFSWLQQILAITSWNLKNMRGRLGASVSTIVGVTGVVLVFVALLSIAAGFRRTMSETGDPESVLILRAGSTSEMLSGFGGDTARVIADLPGIARARSAEAGVAGAGGGAPLASAELFVIVDLPRRGSGSPANVPMRGVEETAFDLRPSFTIVEGRNFTFGTNELVAGRGAAVAFDGLEVGNTLELGDAQWTVVGIFESEGSVEESEVWSDARVLQPAYNRGNSFQSVHARLESAAGFDAFKERAEADPRLNVKVVQESTYYAEQSQVMTNIIATLGIAIGLLMGFGATFGALNTMYMAVASRTREIATLRALGFGPLPVVVSVLVESIMLALIGGLLGSGLAFVLFNGFRTATLNFQSFSQVAFAFAVTAPLMMLGITYALLMGFAGGLLPAIRAARLPVSTALRAL